MGPRLLNPDGSLRYPVAWQDTFFGDHILVNGKVWPFLEVKQGKYRFRLLNGSTSRTLRLALSTGAPFQVLGMEGGLLPAPQPVGQVTLGPGERADVVVDFAPYPLGTTLFLQNDAPVIINFLWLSGQLPSGVALLLAAIAGVLLVAIPGSGRIVQLRRAARRAEKGR